MKINAISLLALLLLFNACGGGGTTPNEEQSTQEYTLERICEGSNPWGMDWLPDGRMLLTEKSGELYLVDMESGERSAISGVPEVYLRGQGGLLDVKVHPRYPSQPWIYLSYSEKSESEKGGSTALIRAQLENDSLVKVEKLLRALPNSTSGIHFGSRITFDPEGYLYVSVGERGQQDYAQDLDKHNGKVFRLHDDGRIPQDNPFVNTIGALPEIWSYGHRNPQGLTTHPETGEIWSNEHGPQGGDEINLIGPGKNYGWPLITHGVNYDGTPVSDRSEAEGLEQPMLDWTPSIAPCGMTFVSGGPYPEWQGNLLSGSLKFHYIARCSVENGKVVDEEKLFEDFGRMRNIKQAPDGFIYLAVEGEDGGVFRIVPESK